MDVPDEATVAGTVVDDVPRSLEDEFPTMGLGAAVFVVPVSAAEEVPKSVETDDDLKGTEEAVFDSEEVDGVDCDVPGSSFSFLSTAFPCWSC